MPWFANGVELSNGEVNGKIIDSISLEEINTEPGKSIVFGTFAFNIKTLLELFGGVIELYNINIDISDFDEFFSDPKIQDLFNPQGGPLRFINIDDQKVIDDLRQLYLRMGGGEATLYASRYNTRRSPHGNISEIKYEKMAAMKKMKKTKERKKKKKKTKRKKKKKKRKSKMR